MSSTKEYLKIKTCVFILLFSSSPIHSNLPRAKISSLARVASLLCPPPRRCSAHRRVVALSTATGDAASLSDPPPAQTKIAQFEKDLGHLIERNPNGYVGTWIPLMWGPMGMATFLVFSEQFKLLVYNGK
ncbi:hypothetical protein F2P56_024773 [Juglans regia]|uniref:Uncharacterized protein n=1 Tax=Juglans regia TaxID=51240 RepID=A0A833X9G1_JUGRE|nr:hypothetical protein F2P56_024773 [Juglans regia]